MTADSFDTVLVVDFGAQYAQLIARRVREAHVYSEIVPRSMPLAEMLARRPKGIILSGGPASVHVEDAPAIDAALYDSGVPVLGICYGAQLVAQQLGGEVAGDRQRRVRAHRAHPQRSHARCCSTACPVEQAVWMSHGDAIVSRARRLRRHRVDPARRWPRSSTASAASTACSSTPRSRTPSAARRCSSAFLFDVCDCRPTWTNTSIIEQAVDEIRAQVGSERVICGLSGGVDSAVAAALVHKAVGDQLTCVFVDTGLLRSTKPSRWRRRSAASSPSTSCT